MISTSTSSPTRRLALLGLALISAGCMEFGPGRVDDLETDRLTIVNDEAALARRVTPVDDDTLVIDETAHLSGADGAAARAPTTLRLVLRAQVATPEIDGANPQATHIVIDGRYAYIGYNTAGEDFRGGVDVFDVGILGTRSPRLMSQALMHAVDVSAVREHDGRLYVAGATGDPTAASPAVLEEITLTRGQLTDQVRSVDLPSFAATSVDVQDDNLVVTTGNSAEGGVFAVDPTGADLAATQIASLPDARAVDVEGRFVAAMSGSPGQLHLFEDGNPIGTVDVGGGAIANSKGAVELAMGHAFVAVGEGGLKVVRLADGAIVEEVTMDQMVGTVDENTVSNSVTVNGNLVFVANGGGGLFVLLAWTDRSGDLHLNRVGRIVLPTGNASVNHVASRGLNVFTATGIGGLHVVGIARR